jgi:RNA-directed DNA polymerase
MYRASARGTDPCGLRTTPPIPPSIGGLSSCSAKNGRVGRGGGLLVEQEKSKLEAVLRDRLGLTLSPEKSLVTPVTSTMRFLGHHLRVRRRPTTRRLVPRLVIPKDRSVRLRQTITGIFDRKTLCESLESRLRLLNPVLRGWGNFYRHAWGAKRIFAAIDHHVWWTILRWLRKKHPDTRRRDLNARW